MPAALAALPLNVSGCITVSDGRETKPAVVELVAPTPGTAPLPATAAELDRDLAGLEARLAAVPDGATADEGGVLDACLRIAALARDAISRSARERVGLSNFDYLLLLEAERECPDEPGKAGQSLRGIIEGLVTSVPTGPPVQ